MAASEAGVAFVDFLKSAGLPEKLWSALLQKVESGELGTDGQLKAVQEDGMGKVFACSSLDAASTVFLVAHAARGTRMSLLNQLSSDSSFLASCQQLLQLPAGPGERTLAEVYKELWAWASPAPVPGASGEPAASEWYLDSQVPLWARHLEDPAAKVAALPSSVTAALSGAGADELAGVSMLWLTRDVPAGAELTRDHLPGKRSLQRAAALLALLGQPPRRWAEEGQYQALRAAVDEAVRLQLPPGVGQPLPRQVIGDRRPAEAEGITKELLMVWTDYPLVREHLEAGNGPFVITEHREAADIVFTPRPVQDFSKIPSHVLVNQFPYEACLIRKDLLPQTLRRLQSASSSAGASDAASQDPSDWLPAWFPASYDLATEVHFFLKDYHQRAAQQADNFWVVKLAQGARSADVFVSDLMQAIVCHRTARGDRIVQACVRRPVLFQGRKVDLRAYLAVRSFEKGEAFLYRHWYGRVAQRPYSLEPGHAHDHHRHFTVSCYDPDEAVRSQQLMVSNNDLIAELRGQGLDTADIEAQLRELAHSLVIAGSYQIGAWPRSRAVYGLDVLLEQGSAAGTCSVKLLEVNFCPDFTTIAKMEPGFVTDVFACLFAHGPAPAGFWPLGAVQRPASALDDID